MLIDLTPKMDTILQLNLGEKPHREKDFYTLLKKSENSINKMTPIIFTYTHKKVRQRQRENGSEPQYMQLKSLTGGFKEDFYFIFICFYNLLGFLR